MYVDETVMSVIASALIDTRLEAIKPEYAGGNFIFLSDIKRVKNSTGRLTTFKNHALLLTTTDFFLDSMDTERRFPASGLVSKTISSRRYSIASGLIVFNIDEVQSLLFAIDIYYRPLISKRLISRGNQSY